MFSKTSIAALFAGLAAAQHAPVGEPSGNPITAPLSVVCLSPRVARAALFPCLFVATGTRMHV